MILFILTETVQCSYLVFKAINQLLIGLPFSLHDGFISGVTARVPFPNPLTSSVGLHIRSLQLTLHVLAEHQVSSPVSPLFSGSALADSVASVAETFVHGELTPREEATLRESLKATPIPQSQFDEDENLPGSFKSFPDGQSGMRGSMHGDNDPAGVSVFANFIERLLARFEFSALDTKITIVHPGNSSFTFTIQEVLYRTEGGEVSSPQDFVDNKPTSETMEQERQAQVRKITLTGLSVTSRNLRPLTDSPLSTAGPLSPTSQSSDSPYRCNHPLSPTSSTSSLDEETQLMMSQSIAMLPPRPRSPADSLPSSMYHSAISIGGQSTSQSISPQTYATPRVQGGMCLANQPSVQTFGQDVILSFGSQPVTIQLHTPPPNSRHSEKQRSIDEGLSPDGNLEMVREGAPEEVLRLSVSVGTLACALRTCHIRMLLELVDACGSSSSPSPPAQRTSQPSPVTIPALQVHIAIRGFVVILLSEIREGQLHSLSSYFEHPFTPPRLRCTYVRFLLDDIDGSLQILARAPHSSGPSATSSDKPTPTTVSAAVSDLSLLVFYAISTAEDPQVAAPLIVTDGYLPSLERSSHYCGTLDSAKSFDAWLPAFDVTDWTQEQHRGKSTRLSTWRTKLRRRSEQLRSPLQKPGDISSSPNPFQTSPLVTERERLLLPAIEVVGQFITSGVSSLDTKVVPLHVFLDLDMMLGGGALLEFVNEVTSSSVFVPQPGSKTPHAARSSNPLDLDDLRDCEPGCAGHSTEPSLAAQAREREMERKRLEKLVLDDLDLKMDYEGILKDFGSTKTVRARSKPRKVRLAYPGITLC